MINVGRGRTAGNHIMVELDPENDHIKLKDGGILYVDTTFDPEKHVTVIGTVRAIPDRLVFDEKKPGEMPWDTDLELEVGDKVIMHYLAVLNCLRNEIKKYWIEDGRRYIFIQYRSIFTILRGKEIIPINGYCLIEPMSDKYIEDLRSRADEAGIMLAGMKEKNNQRVVYGRVAYAGAPNRRYFEEEYTDEGTDIKPGDEVVMKKITDIPVEFEYHAKIDGGRKLWRVQRRDIMAIL